MSIIKNLEAAKTLLNGWTEGANYVAQDNNAECFYFREKPIQYEGCFDTDPEKSHEGKQMIWEAKVFGAFSEWRSSCMTKGELQVMIDDHEASTSPHGAPEQVSPEAAWRYFLTTIVFEKGSTEQVTLSMQEVFSAGFKAREKRRDGKGLT